MRQSAVVTWLSALHTVAGGTRLGDLAACCDEAKTRVQGQTISKLHKKVCEK